MNVKKDTLSTLAANAAATLAGFTAPAMFAVKIAGTFSATITFKVTVDGTNWDSIELYPVSDLADTALTATATAAGTFVTKMPLAVAGFKAEVTTFASTTSGAITIRSAE